MCINVSDFYMKIINNKHTLLYNRLTTYLLQRYNGLCELIKCSNESNKKKFVFPKTQISATLSFCDNFI